MKYICRNCGKPTNNIKFIGEFEIHRCDDCEKRFTKKIEWEMENEHWHENTIICPYCDYEYEQYDSYYYDEGEDTVECLSCGKKFDLDVEEVRYFSTKRNVDEMPEDWDGDEE